MTLQEMTNAAVQLLTVGDIECELDDVTSLVHYDLNEAPDLIDESSFGFHMNAGWGALFVDEEEATLCQIFDLVGTGGRARACNVNNARMQRRMDRIRFAAQHGRAFYQYFNDDIDTVPEYTIEAWVILAAREPGAGEYYFAQWDGSGESLASNFLFRFGITLPA